MGSALYSCYRLEKAMNADSTSPSSEHVSSGRKGSKKVRTGCITCKIRKVKCDESKPFCLRCTKTGRKCDGYLDPRALSKRRSKGQDGGPPHSLAVLLDWASQEERRSFQFFQHVTAPSLSGDFDGAFWRVLVLQICQTEPAVRHAVLAVSSLHEGLTQVGPGTPCEKHRCAKQSFALQQYNKAIASLLEQMAAEPTVKPMASLLTCVLFVCIEFMQSKEKESLIHLEQGRQILSQLEDKALSRDPEIEAIKEHLVPMYTRLSLTSFLFGGSPVPIPPSLKVIKDIPSVFESIAEVRYCMHDFMEEALRFTQKARPAKSGEDVPEEERRHLEDEQDFLMGQLANLNVAFSLFRASQPKAAPEKTAHFLQLCLHAVHIWVSTALSPSEAVYDEYIATFAAMIPLAASYLEAEASDRASPAPKGPQQRSTADLPSHHAPDGRKRHGTFTFETNVIPPLYYIATKCRHPLIRRSALDLLRRNQDRRENVWRVSVIGAIAGHIVDIEERMARQEDTTLLTTLPQGRFRSADVSPALTPETLVDMAAVTAAMDEGIPSTSVHAAIPDLKVDDFDLELGPLDSSLLMDMAMSSPQSVPSLCCSSQDGMSTGSPPDHLLPFVPQAAATSAWPWESLPNTTSCPPMAEMLDGGLMDMNRRPSSPSRWDCADEAVKLNVTAPFGLPEHLRVHDAILGPEKEDGVWVTALRRPHGTQGDWEAHSEYVMAWSESRDAIFR